MTSKEAPTAAASENTNVGQDDDEGKEDWISLVFQLMRGTHKYQQAGYQILAIIYGRGSWPQGGGLM